MELSSRIIKQIRFFDPSLINKKWWYKNIHLKNREFVFLQAAEFLDIPDLFNVLNAATTKQDTDNNPMIMTKTISSLEDLCLVRLLITY